MIMDGELTDSVPVSEAPPLLAKYLTSSPAAKSILYLPTESRMIHHCPAMHAPATKLPWPLSKLQMHDVQLYFYGPKLQGDQIRPSRRFKKEAIDIAIAEFLSGAAPSDEVLIVATL
jgi:hypothetical protein